MKRTVSLVIAAFAAIMLLQVPAVKAQSPDRGKVKAAFQQLMKEGDKAQKTMLTRTPQTQGGAQPKFDIAPMDHIACPDYEGTVCESGVMVWFQLSDGRFINPIHHKWQRRERFKVFIRVPVPAYVALYQNYPEDRPPSRQVYPDLRYPDTFDVIPPGVDFCLPVTFEMDNDLRDEIMSMVVARIDEPYLADYRPIRSRPASVNANITNIQGDVNVYNESGTVGIGGDMKAPKEVYKYMQDQNDLSLQKKNPKAKFIISGCDHEYGDSADDVAFFMLSPGKTAQWQLTLKKD